jgi:hypothetical protein
MRYISLSLWSSTIWRWGGGGLGCGPICRVRARAFAHVSDGINLYVPIGINYADLR